MSNVTMVEFFRPPNRPTGGTVYVRPSEPYARDEDLEPPPFEESAGSPSPNPRQVMTDKDFEGRSAPDLLPQVSEPEKVVEPAVAKAVENGHTVEWDAPAGLTAVMRWTCTRCGDAVLDNRGHLYGGAVDRTCDESVQYWAEWR